MGYSFAGGSRTILLWVSFEAKWLEEYQGPDLMYRIPIGSYLVPVVNNSDKYSVTVTRAEAKQLAKLKHKQLELFDQKEKEWGRALGDFGTGKFNVSSTSRPECRDAEEKELWSRFADTLARLRCPIPPPPCLFGNDIKVYAGFGHTCKC